MDKLLSQQILRFDSLGGKDLNCLPVSATQWEKLDKEYGVGYVRRNCFKDPWYFVKFSIGADWPEALKGNFSGGVICQEFNDLHRESLLTSHRLFVEVKRRCMLRDEDLTPRILFGTKEINKNFVYASELWNFCFNGSVSKIECDVLDNNKQFIFDGIISGLLDVHSAIEKITNERTLNVSKCLIKVELFSSFRAFGQDFSAMFFFTIYPLK